jgi:hypothetical protein
MEVNVKKDVQNVSMMTRSSAASAKNDVANVHQTDSDADIVDTPDVFDLMLTKLVSKSTKRKVNEDVECEVLVEDPIDMLICGKAHPKDVVINEVSTSSKTEDSTLTAVSPDTQFYKVMADDTNVNSFAEMDHTDPLVAVYEQ